MDRWNTEDLGDNEATLYYSVTVDTYYAFEQTTPRMTSTVNSGL